MKGSHDYISTWIYLDSQDESSEYPQVGKASHLPEFQRVYWRCVAVFYAVSTQTNPERKHVLFTNVAEENLPIVDGVDIGSLLKEKNVAVVTLPLTWQAPKGWHGKWRNQFYIFDILQFIENQYNPSGEGVNSSPDKQEPAFVVLDSDCIVNRSLDALFTNIRDQKLLTLPMHFADDYNINGLTRTDMRQVFAELDGSDPVSTRSTAAVKFLRPRSQLSGRSTPWHRGFGKRCWHASRMDDQSSTRKHIF